MAEFRRSPFYQIRHHSLKNTCFGYMVVADPYKTNQGFRVALEWCDDQFGPRDLSRGSLNPSKRWSCSLDRLTISFKSETDAAAFKMRWC